MVFSARCCTSPTLSCKCNFKLKNKHLGTNLDTRGTDMLEDFNTELSAQISARNSIPASLELNPEHLRHSVLDAYIFFSLSLYNLMFPNIIPILPQYSCSGFRNSLNPKPYKPSSTSNAFQAYTSKLGS